MKPSLAGCWAKLERAEEQLQTLDIELTRFVEENPYEITDQPERTPSGFLVFRYTKVPEVPLRAATIVGEIIHDLRSCLDHLVWQLVLLNNETPSRSDEFPICELWGVDVFRVKRQAWLRDGRRKIKKLSADHRAIIKSLQPCHRMHGAQTHPLFVLTELWNTDKHRVLHAASFAAPEGVLPSRVALDTGGYSGLRVAVGFSDGPIQAQAPALKLRVDSAPYGVPNEVHVEADPPVQIQFGEAGTVTRDLYRIGGFIVEHVLERFTGDFRESARTLLHEPPLPEHFPTEPTALVVRPEETRKRFGGWKVWFDAGLFVPQFDGSVKVSEPMWHFEPASGEPGFAVGARSIDPERLRHHAQRHIEPDVLDEIFEYFKPTRRRIDNRDVLAPT